MTTKAYRSLKAQAIDWCQWWESRHMAKAEKALNAGDDVRFDEQMRRADRAHKIAEWLITANKKQFKAWMNEYQTTGYAYPEGM